MSTGCSHSVDLCCIYLSGSRINILQNIYLIGSSNARLIRRYPQDQKSYQSLQDDKYSYDNYQANQPGTQNSEQYQKKKSSHDEE